MWAFVLLLVAASSVEGCGGVKEPEALRVKAETRGLKNDSGLVSKADSSPVQAALPQLTRPTLASENFWPLNERSIVQLENRACPPLVQDCIGSAWCERLNSIDHAVELAAACRSGTVDDESILITAGLLAGLPSSSVIAKWVQKNGASDPGILDAVVSILAYNKQFELARSVASISAELSKDEGVASRCERGIRDVRVAGPLGRIEVRNALLHVATVVSGPTCRKLVDEEVCKRAADSDVEIGSPRLSKTLIVFPCLPYLEDHPEDTADVYLSSAIAGWPRLSTSPSEWIEEEELAMKAIPHAGAFDLSVLAIEMAVIYSKCEPNNIKVSRNLANGIRVLRDVPEPLLGRLEIISALTPQNCGETTAIVRRQLR
jgi:hypothetical protein